jgi:hypothetical protein
MRLTTKLLSALTLFAMALLLFPGPARANTLNVGPGQQFATPCQAVAAAGSGDTILIDTSGSYTGDVCQWSTNGLTLMGVGSGRAVINAAGNNSQGKGTWVISGNNTTVANIEFTGATVPDQNGAGIRQEGNNLTVRNCYFHDNQEGILTDGGPGTILIEFSEFARNGFGDGFTHNMYIGNVTKFILRYSYSHDAIVGHLVKSRAAENDILYNRITDGPTANSSYEIDIPNGGLSYIIGNLIEQGPQTGNSTIVSYQEEGAASGNPDHELFVTNNTIVNDYPNGGTFVLVDGSVAIPAVIKNNILVGPGGITNQASAVRATNFNSSTVSAAKLVDPVNFDYHLQAQSPAVDTGADPGTGAGVALAPVFQYVHPLCAEGRNVAGAAMDIGAYELNGGTGVPPANAPSGCGSGGPPPAPVANLSPASLTFASQNIGTTSAAQTITLSNTGNAALGVSGIAVGGANSGDFSQTNTCGASVAAGANCGIAVRFSPTATGARGATLSVTDNAAGSPHSATLSGTGSTTQPKAPVAQLTPATLAFAGQLPGTTSAAKTVSLSNTGDAALTISSIAASGDFAQSNNCGVSVASAAACTISVTFKPSIGGIRTGTLSVSDNATGSPHTAALSGTGADFALSLSSNSATVGAGQSASATLVVTPDGGFNQGVSLSCSGSTTGMNCSVSPSSVTLNGTSASSATVTITTTARSLGPWWPRLPPPEFPRLIEVLALALCFALALKYASRRVAHPRLGMLALLVCLAAGCTGTTGKTASTTNGTSSGTPAGTVTLTVTATSGTISHNTTFALKVN